MTWEHFFLGCFAFGFVLSLIAFLAGSAHLHFHMHHGARGHVHGGGASKFNFGTIAAFLTWFGGAGYILSSWGRIGLAADPDRRGRRRARRRGVIIFLFAAKVLAPGDQPLDPADYRMIGALGTVSSPVRAATEPAK